MASLTKPIVSYAVLQLVDAGLLDLDEPLSRSIPAIVPEDPRSTLITIHHVLTHTCGLENIRGKEPVRIYFSPGSWFSYSSLGFSLLQSAVEIRTGEGLEATLRGLVFEPLGMNSSSLVWQERFLSNMVTPPESGERLETHRPPRANASYSLFRPRRLAAQPRKPLRQPDAPGKPPYFRGYKKYCSPYFLGIQ